MPSSDEYTDSEDELESGVQTTVQLGLPDGPMDNETHLHNPTYSRFGGQPVRATRLRWMRTIERRTRYS